MLATLMIPVMNLALIVGVGTVMPLSLGEKFVPWTVAALSVAVALFLAPGPLAGLFVVPWLVLTLVSGIRSLLRRQWWPAMVAGFAGTASLALLASRLEFTFLGITEPIVKLTALHFTYAGAGTLALALRLHRLRPDRGASAARGLVFVAPPVVALGFITHSALAQVGGASLMTAGVWWVALLQFPDARSGPRKWLWRISCLSPLVAMVLAVSWAAAQYWPAIPALIIPDMVPTHGALNAFGFVLCGHLARGREVTSLP